VLIRWNFLSVGLLRYKVDFASMDEFLEEGEDAEANFI
jgi:hypothetical protein